MQLTKQDARRRSTASLDLMPGAWSEDTDEMPDKVDVSDEDVSPSTNPPTSTTSEDKGKARMTDDEFALSLFVEEALMNFSEYNEEYGSLMDGRLWNEDSALTVFEDFKNAQMNETARADLAFALSILEREKKDDAEGGQAPENPFEDSAMETPIVSSSSDLTNNLGHENRADIASLLLTYRELSNAGLLSPGAIPPVLSRGDCGVCGDKITGRVITLDCGHVYDLDCTLSMFSTNVNDELRFPPRCCGNTLPLALICNDLPAETRALYEAKIIEYSTPQRLYCSNIHCGQFLGPRGSRASEKVCVECNASTCAACNSPAHDAHVRCKIDKGLKKALVLGQSRGWQRCPGCRQLVERNNGCYHMSCRCGYQFCYLCAAQWKTCSCSGGTSRFLRIFTMRKMRIRGDYLLDTEYGAKHDGPLKRLWKGTIKTVGRSSRG